ncbi:branched-chain amino acid ABC transporter permease [Nocardioides sp. JQ2195]|uniref:branched-chain amino acid ABC transporter permease n=1 Tax=Nocardioides sp. JQ2195 TaxID=2592334 RepID=UPI00143EA6E0|nr:branched-chain amino acid ABC transporter permease [Nocardioides sp. JQ2195]QIX26406.1 branched-chain amino acid ABC transporter permease [Nocardioides sp. JQ2195]
MDWGSIISQTLSALIGWEVVAYSLAAMGLNIHFGYTGLLNFGQAGFMAVGAYGVAMGVSTFGMSLFVAVLFAIAFTVLLALLLGIPTLRLRADYLAIVTIATGEILRLFFRSATLSEWTGGSDGLQGNPLFTQQFKDMNPYTGPLDIGPLFLTQHILWTVTVGWVLIALGVLVTWLLMRSPWGRVIKGIREDEEAVRSLGKNVFAYKMQSLIIGGLFGAAAGMIIALAASSANPDNFAPQYTFFAYTVLLLGGAARVFGPVVGAVIFVGVLVFVDAVLKGMLSDGIIPEWLMDGDQVGQVRFILIGLVLMLLMIFRPQGIFGDKKELQLDAR